MATLLAVDVGLRTGLALYDATTRLLWYRSQNYGTAARLKRAAHGTIASIPDLEHLIVEGGGNLAQAWLREAERRGVETRSVHAHQWRRELFLSRDHRDGTQAKASAIELAPKVIEWAQGKRPTSLRHDAAEAILVGLWGLRAVGWIERRPDFFQ